MKLIDMIVEPSVLCPKDKMIVLLSDCNLCKYFYGYVNECDKIGCEYIEEVDVNGE